MEEVVIDSVIPSTRTLTIGSTDIVFMLNDMRTEYLVSSKDLADLFEKENKNVMRSVKEIDETFNEAEEAMHSLNTAKCMGNNYPKVIHNIPKEGRLKGFLNQREVFLLIKSIGGPAMAVYLDGFRLAYHKLECMVKIRLNVVREETLIQQERLIYEIENVNDEDRDEFRLYINDVFKIEEIVDITELPTEREFTVGDVTLTFVLTGNDYMIYSHELAKVFNVNNFNVMKSYYLIIDELNQFRNKSTVKNDEGAISGGLKRGAIPRNGTDDNNAVSKQLPINKTAYIDKQDKERPALLLNRRAVILIISRMRGILPLNYMNDFYTIFEQLEKAVVDNLKNLNTKTLIELEKIKHGVYLIGLKTKEERRKAKQVKEELENTIQGMLPTHDLGTRVMESKGCKNLLTLATYFTFRGKIISRFNLIVILRDMKIFQKEDPYPYHTMTDNGYFNIVDTIKHGRTYKSAVITEKGFKALHTKIQNHIDNNFPIKKKD